MSQKKEHIIYSAADIEKYHKGLLSAKEMHALEKAALDDPFLADALEGYALHNINFPADIADLKNRLTDRTGDEKKVIPISVGSTTSFPWWKIAAMIVFIAGAGLIVYQFGFNKKPADIAVTTQKETKKTEEKKTDTASPVIGNTDTDTVSTFVTPTEKNKTKTKDDKISVAPLSKEQVDHEAPPNTQTLSNPIPGITTEKTSEEPANDDARRQKISTEKQEEIKARQQQSEADIATNDNQQKKAVAAQSRGVENFYKDQRNRTHSPTNVFRGRVTDAQNNALPFSNIINTQDSVGTYADANGYFNLISPDSVLTVRVSSIGFESNNVQLQNNVPNNNVLLQADRNSLPEIVLSNKKINSNRTQNNSMVLEEPEPADGWVNYDLYLANNLKEPGEFKDKPSGSHGEVELSFEVNENGEPISITVKKSLCEACDKEAIRLLKEGPRWKKKGKRSKARVTVGF